MKHATDPRTSHRLASLKAHITDVRAVCAELEIPIKTGSHRQATGLCPFHDDSRASFSAFIGRDGALHFRCHACGAHGDVIELVARVRGITARGPEFLVALELTEELAGRLRTNDAATTRRRTSCPDTFNGVATSLLRHAPFVDDIDVSRYLVGRGIALFARRDGWGALPGTEREQRTLIEQVVADVGESAWASSGLENAAGGFMYAEHRLVIPWRGPGGDITGLQRRRLDEGDPRYVVSRDHGLKWPYGTEHLFGLDGLRTAGHPLVICEGALDVLAYREIARSRREQVVVIGIPSATGWITDWADLGRGRRVLVAVDADTAGNTVATTIMRDLTAAGALDVRRVVPEVGTDWAEQLEASS